jgi:outer membrane protein TolC
MSPRFLPAAAALAAILPILAAAEPLSLQQALDLATQRSASARAARAATSGAAEAARAAGQLPDPVLGLGIENLPVTGPERLRTTVDSMTMKRVGISQEWVSPGKRALREAAARAQVGREATTEQAVLTDTKLQTAMAYLDAYFAGETLKLTTLNEHHAQEEFQAARARLASSAGAAPDVLAIAAARGLAEDESSSARQSEAAARVTLERWVGARVDTLVAPSLPAVPDEHVYVAAHPAVLQAQRELEVARAEASATAANRTPNWTWQAAYGQRSGFADMVSIGVSIPLPVAPGERQDRETAARLALVGKAEATLEESTRMATAEYRSLASDVQRLAQRIDRYRAAVVAPSQQRVQAALAGYRSNQVPLTALFEARHADVENQRKLLALQRELARVQAQLAFRPMTAGGAR